MKHHYRSTITGRYVTGKHGTSGKNSVVKELRTPTGTYRTVDASVVGRAVRAANTVLSDVVSGGGKFGSGMKITQPDGNVRKR